MNPRMGPAVSAIKIAATAVMSGCVLEKSDKARLKSIPNIQDCKGHESAKAQPATVNLVRRLVSNGTSFYC